MAKNITNILAFLLSLNISVNGQTLTVNKNNKKELFLTFDVGVSSNYSIINNVDYSKSQKKYSLNNKPLYGLSYAIGLEKVLKNLFLGLKFKRVNIGNLVYITSVPDSLNNSYSIYASASKTNFISKIYTGYIFRINKIQIRPSIGLEYLLTPNLNSYSSFIYGDVSDSVYITNISTYTKKLPILLTSDINIGYTLKIKNKRCFIFYDFAYSHGFNNLYNSKFTFYKKTDIYSIDLNNTGVHLSHSIKFILEL